jgi:N-alpha-acetyltransferase 38, NatC auxiliary subunit
LCVRFAIAENPVPLTKLSFFPSQQSNLVLSLTHEYRQPSQQKLLEAAASLESDTLRAEMTSRYLGLVVVPGEHIVKIEVEEFVSQMKNRSILGRPDIYASG